MQKLIIIRGHSGSGKTTFAKEKIAEFQQQYPIAHTFHIENDLFIEQDGKYEWTEERFQQAKKLASQAVKNAFNFAKNNPSADILIIVSNVGINTTVIHGLQQSALKLKMHIEVYRMQNFFPNLHNVSEEKVYSMYLALNDNPIQGEIFIESVSDFPKIMGSTKNYNFGDKKAKF
ncbi:hypothetical protein PTQ27_03880 [Mannheimia sp. AT1]|uniref:UDP-N-acetylglucosamine kinase n=1 Tax=Mannheimia cairinae TaxID=3025936 RepID=A0ABT5MQ54_9PAST|nr:hypothetical protein [Mannheimia cairinae]MDD0823614.1 hypothetical protein [Mannheimia cairinae]MDD0825454.1 hypothetical protein [Mannheimia cairinae]